ncbi:D5 N terminal like [Thorsellia anophelis DSM 18579]|uniref:D5 N terminal like n=1 Tax=Thorsellia anophelis DSM 18579 TaxID=1123402 RepID=A0A1H9YER6_9GAMM|nr:D5 N terminal like [Thorsellia anophelis DSM 18579]
MISNSHDNKPNGYIKSAVRNLLSTATPNTHPYLIKKGYDNVRVKVLPDGKAIIPLVTLKGEITGAQTITLEGEKRLLTGTKKVGKFALASKLIEQPSSVIIAEGFATALALKSISDDTALVLSAIDAGNLIHVARVIREAMPEVKIIIGADNDLLKDSNINTGKAEAEKAALAVNGWVALPPTPHKADWDDYRRDNGVEATRKAFNELLYQPEEQAPNKAPNTENGKTLDLSNSKPKKTLPLSQMGASQRGEVLLHRYGGDLALEELTELVHFYDGTMCRPITDRELMREMVAVFIEADEPYTSKGVQSAVDALKLQLPLMSKPISNIIGFKNGIFDLEKGEFRAHDRHDWLVVSNDITFTHAEAGETLATHAPNFWQWLNRAAAHDSRKKERILAALFMVLANRYDWQLFLEITVAGGSGKSVLSDIFTLLAGKVIPYQLTWRH